MDAFERQHGNVTTSPHVDAAAMLFFLHIPRTAGRTYHTCFLKVRATPAPHPTPRDCRPGQARCIFLCAAARAPRTRLGEHRLPLNGSHRPSHAIGPSNHSAQSAHRQPLPRRLQPGCVCMIGCVGVAGTGSAARLGAPCAREALNLTPHTGSCGC